MALRSRVLHARNDDDDHQAGWGILGDLLAFLIPADVYDTWRND